MNLFAERFLPLIEKSGKTDQELEKAMGLPRSIIYDWKMAGTKAVSKNTLEILQNTLMFQPIIC